MLANTFPLDFTEYSQLREGAKQETSRTLCLWSRDEGGVCLLGDTHRSSLLFLLEALNQWDRKPLYFINF